MWRLLTAILLACRNIWDPKETLEESTVLCDKKQDSNLKIESRNCQQDNDYTVTLMESITLSSFKRT